jgi:Cof subfamily protein (haloacid dehalogenase superfamily)
MSAIRMVIADVDGTLVTKDKRLTARTCAAVARLRAAGIRFGITSGRPPRGMSMLIEPLGMTTPVAAFNGGMLVRPDLTTVIEQRTLALAVASEVVEALEQAGLDVWVYRGVDWFIRRPEAFRVERERSNVQFDPIVLGDLRGVLEGAVKIVGVSPDEPLVARCEAELQRRLGPYASAARSQPYYLDITHPEANKGMVVRLASRHLGIALEEIAVIGDMPNDVLMFGVAGTSIAMGNASAEVKRTARYVTTSNEEEGFANAVDWFVLGEPRSAQRALGLPPGTRACLFELDGVLTQTDRLHALAWKKTFDEYLRGRVDASGGPPVPYDPAADYVVYLDGKLAVDAARSFLASRGIRPAEEELAELARRKDEHLAEQLRTRGSRSTMARCASWRRRGRRGYARRWWRPAVIAARCSPPAGWPGSSTRASTASSPTPSSWRASRRPMPSWRPRRRWASRRRTRRSSRMRSPVSRPGAPATSATSSASIASGTRRSCGDMAPTSW